MSQALRRAKSPATRNRFNDIGVTGRKTGVRVAGNVLVDDDGLENVDEFYKHTTPPERQEPTAKSRPTANTLHTLVSPTPIRSAPNYESLVGALEMSKTNTALTHMNGKSASDERELERTPPPPAARKLVTQVGVSPELGMGKRMRSPVKSAAKVGNRRTTLAPSRVAALEEDWVRSPKRGRRVTMAFAQRKGLIDDADQPDVSNEEAPDQADEEAVEEEEEEAAVEDPGELTSATVIEENDLADSRDQSDGGEEDDGPRHIVEESYSDAELSDHADVPANDNVEEAGEDEDQEDADPISNYEDPSGHSETEQTDSVDQSADAEAPHSTPGRHTTKGRSKTATKSKSKNADPEPTRRSTRASVQPLAFWRNEHIEYEYETGPAKGSRVPKMKNIVRVRQTREEKNNAKRRRGKQGVHRLPGLSNIKRDELDLNDRGQFYYYDDESFGFTDPDDAACKFGPRFVPPEKRVIASSSSKGKRKASEFSDNDDIATGETHVKVLDQNGDEFEGELVISRHDIEWTKAGDSAKNQYRVGLGLINHAQDGSLDSSSGLLTLAVRGKKPERNSGDKAMFYLVTSGQVEVHMHATKFRVGVLGQFMVPRFNTYAIRNVGTHPAQLFYVHVCSPVVEEEDEEDNEDGPSDSE
ncbi:mitotic fidelity of chromosome transmission- protein [Coemansia erecta]|nr:mitotic fidelity of chromosome transmission- protein [Coemansia sp. RSA 2618]KAJ2827476.1 mitotic fidelity of chromosome transmission- protein [Coemansia erecta]